MRGWRAGHASGVRLRGILGRAAARRRIGLRSDRMHAKRPEDPAPDRQRPPQPARALPAQVKLASPFYPVRRPDRRPAPVTRLSHLAPPAGPGTRPLPQLDCSPLHICLPGPAAGAATHHRAPSPGPEPDHAAPVIVVAPRRAALPAAGPARSSRTEAHPAATISQSPYTSTEPPHPLPDTGRSLNHSPVPKTANTSRHASEPG